MRRTDRTDCPRAEVEREGGLRKGVQLAPNRLLDKLSLLRGGMGNYGYARGKSPDLSFFCGADLFFFLFLVFFVFFSDVKSWVWFG